MVETRYRICQFGVVRGRAVRKRRASEIDEGDLPDLEGSLARPATRWEGRTSATLPLASLW
jgi:hypothetical protein